MQSWITRELNNRRSRSTHGSFYYKLYKNKKLIFMCCGFAFIMQYTTDNLKGFKWAWKMFYFSTLTSTLQLFADWVCAMQSDSLNSCAVSWVLQNLALFCCCRMAFTLRRVNCEKIRGSEREVGKRKKLPDITEFCHLSRIPRVCLRRFVCATCRELFEWIRNFFQFSIFCLFGESRSLR